MPDCSMRGQVGSYQSKASSSSCLAYLYRSSLPKKDQQQRKKCGKKLFESIKCDCGVMVLDLCRQYGCPPEELIYALQKSEPGPDESLCSEHDTHKRISCCPTVPLLEQFSLQEDRTKVNQQCALQRAILCQCREKYAIFKRKWLKELSNQYNEAVRPLTEEELMAAENSHAKRDKCTCQNLNIKSKNRKLASYPTKKRNPKIIVVKQHNATPEKPKMPSPCLMARKRKAEKRQAQLEANEILATSQSKTSSKVGSKLDVRGSRLRSKANQTLASAEIKTSPKVGSKLDVRGSRLSARESQALHRKYSKTDTKSSIAFDLRPGSKLETRSSARLGSKAEIKSRSSSKLESRLGSKTLSRASTEVEPTAKRSSSIKSGSKAQSNITLSTRDGTTPKSSLKLGSRAESMSSSKLGLRTGSQNDKTSQVRLNSGGTIISDSNSEYEPNIQQISKSDTFHITSNHSNNTSMEIISSPRSSGEISSSFEKSSAIKRTIKRRSDSALKANAHSLNDYDLKETRRRRSESAVSALTKSTYGSTLQRSNPDTAASMRSLSKLLRPLIKRNSSPGSKRTAGSSSSYEYKKALTIRNSSDYGSGKLEKTNTGSSTAYSGKKMRNHSSRGSIESAGSFGEYRTTVSRRSNPNIKKSTESTSNYTIKESKRGNSSRNIGNRGTSSEYSSSARSSPRTKIVDRSLNDNSVKKNNRRSSPESSAENSSGYTSRFNRRNSAADSTSEGSSRPIIKISTSSDWLSDDSDKKSYRRNSPKSNRKTNELEIKGTYTLVREQVDGQVEERSDSSTSGSKASQGNTTNSLKVKRSNSPESTSEIPRQVRERLENQEKLNISESNRTQNSQFERSNRPVEGRSPIVQSSRINIAEIYPVEPRNKKLSSIEKERFGSQVGHRLGYANDKMDSPLKKRSSSPRNQRSQSPLSDRFRFSKPAERVGSPVSSGSTSKRVRSIENKNDSLWEDSVKKPIQRDATNSIAVKARNSFVVYTKRRQQQIMKQLAEELNTDEELLILTEQVSEQSSKSNRSILLRSYSLDSVPRRQSLTFDIDDQTPSNQVKTSKVRIAPLPSIIHTETPSRETINETTQTS